MYSGWHLWRPDTAAEYPGQLGGYLGPDLPAAMLGGPWWWARHAELRRLARCRAAEDRPPAGGGDR